MEAERAEVPCPLCQADDHTPWGSENGYDVVRCRGCGFLYCSPQPTEAARKREVDLGQHAGDETIDVNFARSPIKIRAYGRIINGKAFYRERFRTNKPLRWLDIGCGYGEVVEAVQRVAPEGSIVVGVEPNQTKAAAAQAAGLDVRHTFDLDELGGNWDVISMINVFSHLPRPAEFIEELKTQLALDGEIFLETGNAAEIEASEYPDPLYLPDHLCFAGEQHIRDLLTRTDFEVQGVRRLRRDGLLWAGWAIVRGLLGKGTQLFVPYRSPFRTMFVRARLRSTTNA